MSKKIILTSFLLLSTSYAFSNSNDSKDNEWQNDTRVQKSAYSYISKSPSKYHNTISYECSVLKIKNTNFTKISFLNLDLDLELEDGKLDFQDKYIVNIAFSNSKIFSNIISLNNGDDNNDRFTIYLNENDKNSEIITQFMYGNYADIEVVDDSKKRLLYRFGLKGSNKSIKETKNNCQLLYDTFK